MTEIQQILYKYQDQNYADFTSKLVPTVPREKFIGIRSPVYKKVLKEIKDNLSDTQIKDFLQDLPHEYQEENCLHVIFLNNIKINSHIKHFIIGRKSFTIINHQFSFSKRRS